MKDNILILDIIDLDMDGLGIAKHDDKVIFVKNAIPGEKVSVMIYKDGKSYAFANTLDVLKKSPYREEVKCKFYDLCGGCNLMHMSYECELDFKKKKVINTLKKVANIETKVLDVVRNNDIYNYRNKVIMPLGKDISVYRGFFQEKSHKLIKIDECLIENKYVKEVIDYMLELFTKESISIYDEKHHKGLIRNVMFRTNHINEMMIVVVATSNNEKLKEVLSVIQHKFDRIVSVYLNINDKRTNVVLTNEFELISGKKEIIENINGLKYFVSPNTFLQVNQKQTEKLYSKILEYANLSGKEIVIDAYCGMGSISLYLAKHAKKVIGIEVVPNAIKNANNNKVLNSIDNVEFICGKCEDEILKIKSEENIDVIVFDPPRKGCDKVFLDTVINMDIKKIIYVSCKDSTFARDAKYLIENGYELKEVTPFDLFSRTSHVEIVGLFEKVR